MGASWDGDPHDFELPAWATYLLCVVILLLFSVGIVGSITEPTWAERRALQRRSVVGEQSPVSSGLVGDADEANAQPLRWPKTPR